MPIPHPLWQRPRVARTTLGLAAMVGVFALCATLVWSMVVDHQARVDAEHRASVLLVLNDSTTARAARTVGERDSLQALYAAAKQLRGRLVAGVKVAVPPETLRVYDTVRVTTMLPDSTRVAVVQDTTRGYLLRIRASAPPYPGDLSIGYEVIAPTLEPEIGIVERSDGYYAVTSWGGQHAETKYAFYTPPKARRLRAVVGTTVWARPDPKSPVSATVFAGLRAQTRPWEVTAMVAQERAAMLGLSVVRVF